VFETVII